MSIQKYPLAWPEGWKRTPSASRRGAAFKKVESVTTSFGSSNRGKRLSISDAIERVFEELRRLGVKNVHDDIVISTNLKTNLSGVPRGDQGEPSDPGAAVYWELKGARQCMAIDQYYRVADNIAAVAASLGHIRGIERHGGAEILARAFKGFTALPQNAGTRPWREVLDYTSNISPSIPAIEQRYKELARAAHPDTGGSEAKMQELNIARDQARTELKS